MAVYKPGALILLPAVVESLAHIGTFAAQSTPASLLLLIRELLVGELRWSEPSTSACHGIRRSCRWRRQGHGIEGAGEIAGERGFHGVGRGVATKAGGR